MSYLSNFNKLQEGEYKVVDASEPVEYTTRGGETRFITNVTLENGSRLPVVRKTVENIDNFLQQVVDNDMKVYIEKVDAYFNVNTRPAMSIDIDIEVE